jgi:hypothetical protein
MSLLDKKEETIRDLKNFFESYGGFHDSEIIDLHMNLKNKLLFIAISDPLANFKGFENYKYIKYMQIIFEVNSIMIEMKQDFEDQIFLYDIIVEKNEIEILFSPSGKIKFSLNRNNILIKID